MSLKVWLPLDGSLENKGEAVGDKEFSLDNGSAFYDNGKIGKCLNIRNSTSPSVYFGELNGIREFSISIWLKINSTAQYGEWTDIINMSITNGTFINGELRLEHTSKSQIGRWQLSISKPTNIGHDTNNYFQLSTNYNYTEHVNKWVNIVLVKTSERAITYLNGTKIYDYDSSYFGNDVYLTGNVYLGKYGTDAYINDFRIYDHALSDKEVKEINKGLIAHYKLDNSSPASMEKDVSGYGHHATKNGNFEYLNDSIRYIQATKFNATDTIIESSYPTNTAESLSCWIYIGDNISDSIICITGKNNIALGFSENTIITTSDYVNKKYKYNTKNIIRNSWNHFCVIKQDAAVDILYINGINQSNNIINVSDYWRYESEILIIGCRIVADVYKNFFNGGISDIRIYATALSEDDVKELYETSAIIDDKGNLFAYDFVEGNDTKIGKNGVINASTFETNNNGDCKIYADGKISANKFIAY